MTDSIIIPFSYHVYQDIYQGDPFEIISKTFRFFQGNEENVAIYKFHWDYYKWCKKFTSEESMKIDSVIEEQFLKKSQSESSSAFLIRIIDAVIIARIKALLPQPDWLWVYDREIAYMWTCTPNFFDGDPEEEIGRNVIYFNVVKEDFNNAFKEEHYIVLRKFYWAYYDWLKENDPRDIDDYIWRICERRREHTHSNSYEWGIFCIFQDRVQNGMSHPDWVMLNPELNITCDEST